MSDEHVVNVLQPEASMIYSVKDGVTAAGVDKQSVILLCEDEAGVEAFGNKCITISEHSNVHAVTISHSVKNIPCTSAMCPVNSMSDSTSIICMCVILVS